MSRDPGIHIGFTILVLVACAGPPPSPTPPEECASLWSEDLATELVDHLARATEADPRLWGSYGLADGSYVLHAGSSEGGRACLGLLRDGGVVAYAAVPEEPALLTPLYGYYFDSGWRGAPEADMLERARQPASIRSWLEELRVESAVILPVSVPDFPMELPAVVTAQLGIHEAFHVEVQAPRWWAGEGEWPAWDVQPDREGLEACYASTDEVAATVEEERAALVGLVGHLLDGDSAQACRAGADFLSLRAARYDLLSEVGVSLHDGARGSCREAEALMELEEGTADYASWTILYELGQVDRDALFGRYRARQKEMFYLTGAMQLHAVRLLDPERMLERTRAIAASPGPEEGSIASVLEGALGSYCR